MRIISVLFLVSLFTWSCQKETAQPQQIDTISTFDTASFLDCNTMSTAPTYQIDNALLSERLTDARISFVDEEYELWVYYRLASGSDRYINEKITKDSMIVVDFVDIGELEITPLFCADIIRFE